MATNISASSFQKALIFGAWGAVGAGVGSLLGSGIASAMGPVKLTQEQGMVRWALEWGLIGCGVGLAILIGYANYLGRGFQFGEAVKGGAAMGFVAGLVAGAAAHYLLTTIMGGGQARLISAWALAGGLIGAGLGYRIKNLGILRGLLGGAIGGGIGCILAVMVIKSLGLGTTVELLSGDMATGFFIGVMLIIADTLLREAWLEVKYGAKEFRNVSLGTDPVNIGGDMNSCTVYARNAAPVAFRYRLDQGRITCEDIAKGQVMTVQPGHSQPVGNLTITVRATTDAAAPATFGSPTPAPASAGAMGGFQLRLSTGRSVALADGVKLSTTDVPGLQATSGTVVAEVGRNPNDPNVLGLKNMSRNGWTATLANRDQLQIAPGRNVRVAAGTKIAFGSVSADIENG